MSLPSGSGSWRAAQSTAALNTTRCYMGNRRNIAGTGPRNSRGDCRQLYGCSRNLPSSPTSLPTASRKEQRKNQKAEVDLRRSPAAYTCASEVIASLRSLLAQARLKSCYTGWGAAILWNPQRRKSLKGEKAKGCLGQTTDCRHRQPAVASRLHPSGQ